MCQLLAFDSYSIFYRPEDDPRPEQSRRRLEICITKPLSSKCAYFSVIDGFSDKETRTSVVSCSYLVRLNLITCSQLARQLPVYSHQPLAGHKNTVSPKKGQHQNIKIKSNYITNAPRCPQIATIAHLHLFSQFYAGCSPPLPLPTMS